MINLCGIQPFHSAAFSNNLIFLDEKKVQDLCFCILEVFLAAAVNRNTQADLQLHMKAEIEQHIRTVDLTYLLNFVFGA